jgi:hypothetical protein
MTDERKPTQKTTPKGKDKSGKPHEPIDIPVVKRKDVERLLKRASRQGLDQT